MNLARVTADPVFPDGTPAPPRVEDADFAVVTVFSPEVTLTKTVGTQAGVCSGDSSIQVLPGTPVTYCYQITNPGDVDLRSPDIAPGPDTQDGWILDDLGPTGTCDPVAYVSGDSNNDGILAADSTETWTYFCTTPISQDAVNTASVVAATLTDPTVRLTRFDSAEVTVVAPAIKVVKTSARPTVLDPAALEANGGTAVGGPDVPTPAPAFFTFEVSNPGDLPLADVALTDTWPGAANAGRDPLNACPPRPVEAAGFNIGDANQDGLLDSGETWVYTCNLRGIAGDPPRLTKADADPGSDPNLPAPVRDTVTATGTPRLDGQDLARISAKDADSVEVIKPGIRLTKVATPALVRLGGSATYQISIENTGDSDLRPLGVLDDTCSPVEYQSGDVGDDGILAGGGAPETWLYTCVQTLDTLGDVTNTASVLAAGPLGNRYFFEDQAVVQVFDPGIDLVKEVSDELVLSGSQVTYTFTVSNAGQSPSSSTTCWPTSTWSMSLILRTPSAPLRRIRRTSAATTATACCSGPSSGPTPAPA